MKPSDEFIKNCNVTKEDWQEHLDKGSLEYIISNMLTTFHEEEEELNKPREEPSPFSMQERQAKFQKELIDRYFRGGVVQPYPLAAYKPKPKPRPKPKKVTLPMRETMKKEKQDWMANNIDKTIQGFSKRMASVEAAYYAHKSNQYK